ncbi:hypothetical protein NEOLEDRAFT_1129114 [Neolentinus lepideus HHB14362 ss-1]|uniref:Uncharacterized protein n=1 Tax=Neolentinus lepideus HHB14362 ss-1 TaxID=1314782 RepID=A0A165UXP6_9AGAM|nr:hypothetical protein NEOLEDRAFT_1129114 [Neolentinus lepideus HHB14362 ss-1]
MLSRNTRRFTGFTTVLSRNSSKLRRAAGHVSDDSRTSWAIAQRTDAETSRDANIEIGRQSTMCGPVRVSHLLKPCQSTGGHSTTPYFKEKHLEKCLSASHVDSVKAWNFYDLNNVRSFHLLFLTNCDFPDLAPLQPIHNGPSIKNDH